ncbi:fibronectin type-III domain-containing protein 3a isoform X2 [Neocloeon triangulifer]|uniref:fibronectin type-III domain-containing protein 3a isoform X2 n=1 Tax=Neocloeon triangulifer TaxID=2078957 RepID=UPI00286F15B6|nr:fibronectin type-III domain-containing protein 3a isoform X2 [Neocloeon triangulifer]
MANGDEADLMASYEFCGQWPQPPLEFYYPGPMTVPMVPTAGRPSQPPIPMPVQVPVGHVVHQIMDESGQLRHVILSPQRAPEQRQPAPNEYYHAYYTMVPPNVSIPQPPPPRAADDRYRVQRDKMKRRLEQRQGCSSTTPATSPTKKTLPRKTKEMPSSTPPASPASPGLQLSICDVAQTSANLSWAAADTASVSGSEDSGVAEPPPETSTTMYQLSIGKKGKEHKILYFGTDLGFQLDNLHPGTEYSIRLAAVLAGEGGSASCTEYLSFSTLPAPPSTPSQPRLAGRTKTSLTLKWSSCANGGAPLTAYILEMCDVADGQWQPIYKGREKQFTISKLQAGAPYSFRLAAANALGESPFCDPQTFNTQEPLPPTPNPPRLAAPALPDRLLLEWDRTEVADIYKLEQAEELVPSGPAPSFYLVYHGPECRFESQSLQPASAYLYRLKVEANGQCSQPSPPARHITAPAPPLPPARPQLKGRSQPFSLRLVWVPPLHTGGAPILAYKLQIDQGKGFQDVWSGPGCEAVINELAPGYLYQVRVAAINAAGISNYSEVAHLTTAAAAPEPPIWSRKQQPPSTHAVTLHWEPPAFDGGAPVHQYEVEVADEHSRWQAYKGTEPFCVAAGLQAANLYHFYVRAANAAGLGPWSVELPLQTAVAPPAVPEPPSVEVSEDRAAEFSWQPLATAATYGLQLALLEEPSSEPQYKEEYSGQESSCQVVNLAPGSTYLARLQGLNSSGAGPFSTPVVFCTPVSIPGAVAHAPHCASLKSDGSSAQLVVTFEQPVHWGGDSQGPHSFQLETIPFNPEQNPMKTEETTVKLDLQLESTYRLKVRAVNSKGPGPYSPVLKITTPPPPPPAPSLTLLAAQPRALRLGWELDKDTSIILEMRRSELHKFQIVYEGCEKRHKVTQLKKNTEYQFQTKAVGPGGESAPSEIFTFRTKPEPICLPANLKFVETSSSSVLVSWQAPPEHKSRLQLGNSRHGPFTMVYEGMDCQYELTSMTVNTEYWVRASLTLGSEEGAWTAPAVSCIAAKVAAEPLTRPAQAAAAPAVERRARSRALSEEQKKAAILIAFLLMSVVLAVFLARTVTM